MAAEQVSGPSRTTSGGGTSRALSTKVGPLPVWGWVLGLALVGVGAWYWWEHAGASSASDTSDTSGTSGSSPDDDNLPAASAATIQSEIGQLQGEQSTDAAEASSAEGLAKEDKRRSQILTKRADRQESQIKNADKKTGTSKKTTSGSSTSKTTGTSSGQTGKGKAPAKKATPKKRK
jgi:hypothetical protein